MQELEVVPVPVDAEIASVLADLPDRQPMTLDTVTKRREDFRSLLDKSDEALSYGGHFDLTEHGIPGYRAGVDVNVVVLSPTTPSSVPRPVIYNIHGGGMVAGSARSISDDQLAMAHEFGAVLVSVRYRLAPEHVYPAQLEDAYAGLAWLADHCQELEADPARIVVVGSSAGGGIAASLVFLARDRGTPRIAAQMLCCPMLDDRNDSVSALQAENDQKSWNRISNMNGWRAVLGPLADSSDLTSYAVPARSTDYRNLPPTFVDVGSAELFRDESIAFAQEIWKTGGEAELHVWSGGTHGYYLVAPSANISIATTQARLDWLRRVVSRSATANASE